MRRIVKGTVMIALTLNSEIHDVDVSPEQLHDVAKRARRALQLRREWIDVVREVEAAVGSRVWALARSGYSLSFDVPDAALHAYVDGARLRQLVIDLLDVAGKHTHPFGRIRLTLERAHGWVVCSVERSGAGTCGAVADAPCDMRGALERVREIVELHGGDVESRSRDPDGESVFVVRLPICSHTSLAREL
jgi:signal transduction histidine kinase